MHARSSATASVDAMDLDAQARADASALTGLDAPVANAAPPAARTESPLSRALDAATREKVGLLRARLPVVGTDRLWGVDLTDASDARSDVLLAKFLAARRSDLDDAFRMLEKTLAWRRAFRAADAAREDFGGAFADLGNVQGAAKDGAPVIWTAYGRDAEQSFSRDGERFLRWRVGLQERALARCDWQTTDRIFVVGDYGGARPNADSKAFAKKASEIFAEYYPEILAQHVFLNARRIPTYLTWVIWIFKGIIPGATFRRFHFVGTTPAAHRAELLKWIDDSHLPTAYGGLFSGPDDVFSRGHKPAGGAVVPAA